MLPVGEREVVKVRCLFWQHEVASKAQVEGDRSTCRKSTRGRFHMWCGVDEYDHVKRPAAQLW